MWLLFTLAVLLFVESDSQYIRRRRKKVLPMQQNGHNRPRPVQEKQMTEVQDDANENNYFARKVFRKKMKVLPGTVVTSSPPPIPVRPFQSQNSAAAPAAANTAAVGVFKKKKIIKAFIPKYTTTPMPSPAEENGALNRTEDDPRFLSLFTIVSFKNDACQSGTGNNGTCYSTSDCSKLGGTASGSCASGFGVCCLFTKTCGQETSNNCTYFQNSGYPSTYDSVGSCQLTVNKCDSSVCQLRLDMDNFVLAQPEQTDHQCQSDQLIVSGGSPIPAICGVNSGSHIYVDMGLSSNNPITLTVVTSGSSFSRSFSIKVTQLDCYSLSKASDGCLQYFTGVSGQMWSFNYNDASGLQLSNTDYSICVRMERNFCGIQYSACTDAVNSTPMSFSITGQGTESSQVGVTCNTDWITIPCATNSNDPVAQTGTPSVCVDRICGMVFNSVTGASSPSVPVTSYSKPFNIRVHTDSLEGTSSPSESANRGFCFNYVQQPCNSATGK